MTDKTSREKVEGSVIDTIADILDMDTTEVTLEKSITDDLGADSTDQADIVNALEDSYATYGLSIPPEDLPGIRTVGNAVDYVCQHLQQGGYLQ